MSLRVGVEGGGLISYELDMQYCRFGPLMWISFRWETEPLMAPEGMYYVIARITVIAV